MKNKYDVIEIGGHALQRYADLDYDAWYAMAEFVDNSLHAFVNNKKDLADINIDVCEVKISIEGKNASETLNIFDNAGGIAEVDFNRLLTLGQPKEKAKHQLSEFGMGMKTAAFWIGRKIEIETKHYKSDSCYLITIDLEKVNSNKYVFIEEVKPSANLKGYTKIKISNLNRRLSNKTKKIQDSLSSIYRKYIENGDVSISFENIPLEPITYEFLERSDGSPVREDFEIKLENGKSAKGWVAILKKGKTVLSGFSVYRHNRCVQGYPENAWKPKEVFSQEGGSNTRKNQRVVGELDMTAFKVAHTKNRINFIDNEEEEFRKKLGEACKHIAKEGDRKLPPNKPRDIVLDDPNSLVTRNNLESFFDDDSIVNSVDQIELITPLVKDKSSKLVKEIYEKDEPFMRFLRFKQSSLGKHVYIYNFSDSSLPYMIMDTVEGVLCVCINLGHAFLETRLDDQANQEEFYLNCALDAVSEDYNLFKLQANYTPEDSRLTKNKFMLKYINDITRS